MADEAAHRSFTVFYKDYVNGYHLAGIVVVFQDLLLCLMGGVVCFASGSGVQVVGATARERGLRIDFLSLRVLTVRFGMNHPRAAVVKPAVLVYAVPGNAITGL